MFQEKFEWQIKIGSFAMSWQDLTGVIITRQHNHGHLTNHHNGAFSFKKLKHLNQLIPFTFTISLLGHVHLAMATC